MVKTKTDPFVLQVRRRLRDSISREVDRSREAAGKAARDAIYRTVRSEDTTAEKIHNAIVFATSRLGLAVLNSMDVNVPFSASISYQGTQAMTDFKSIKISVDPRAYDLNDIDAVARLIQFTKGLIYHEAGHILYSVPFRKLVELTGKTPDEFSAQFNGSVSFGDLQQAWNCLEDQRMECAMVRMSAIMRTYFSVIVQDFVTKTSVHTGWAWVAGRTYLPKEVLTNFRKAGREYSVTFDPTLVEDTASCVARYKRASTPEDMVQCVVEYEAILRRWRSGGEPVGEGIDRHHPYTEPWTPSGEDGEQEPPTNWVERIKQTATDEPQPKDEDPSNPSPQPAKDKGEDKDDSQEGNGGDSDADPEEDGDDDADTGSGGDSDSDDDAEDGDDTDGGTHGTDGGDDFDIDNEDDSPPPPKEAPTKGVSTEGSVGDARDSSGDKDISDLTETLDEQARQVAKDFMGTVNDEMGRTLPHNTAVSAMPLDDLKKANEVYNGMMRALEPLAVQVDPAWRFGQENGIIDPTGYYLREPGDTNYWIDLDDIGSQGFDLAVSVIIDVSYSMEYMVRDVGIAALGIRKACDALGIPCTVSTFSGRSHVLWEADDEVTDVYPLATGSTNPEGALDALPDQRLGKSRHLIIILTDGVWSDDISLASYNDPGRYFMMVGIGVQVRQMERLGPDVAIAIDGPLQLPDLATNALSGYLA